MEEYALSYEQHRTVVVRFTLSGDDLNPEEITDALGIQPDDSWKKGDRVLPDKSIRLTSRPDRSFGRWMLTASTSPYEDLEIQIENIISTLERLPKTLLVFCQKYNGEIKVGLSSGEKNIGIHLSSATITRLAQLGVAIDFDIYVVSGESSP